MLTGPETVDYGRTSFVPTKINYIDAEPGVKRVRRTFGSAESKLRKYNPGRYLARSADLASREAEAVTDVAGNVQAQNVRAANRASALDARSATRVNMFNKQVGIREAEANAANRAAHRSRISGDLSNIGTMFGQMSRDEKLETANQEYNQRYFDLLEGYQSDLYGEPETLAPTAPTTLRNQQVIQRPEEQEMDNSLFQGSIELPYSQGLEDYQLPRFRGGGSLTHRLRLRNLKTG